MFNIEDHNLVPKHIKLDKEKADKLLQKYNVGKIQLPRISRKDPAIKGLDAKVGDIIKIVRNSPTAGKSAYYRVVAGE